MTRHLLFPAALLVVVAGVGCATVPKKPAPVPSPIPTAFWKQGALPAGEPSIRIVISQQRAYFSLGKEVVGISKISSGKKGFDTPPGHYRVIQKDKDHVSNLYGDYVDEDGNVVKANVDVTKDPKPPDAEFRGAPMAFFMRFTGGYGMHAGYLPGYRASHGCVRMPRAMAEHFFEAAKIGTPVTVEP